MDLRYELIRRHLDGESMTDLCLEYGIARKTGNKYKERFLRLGREGLTDQSRAPHRIPHKTPAELVSMILTERSKHPSWGPKKLKVSLERRFDRAFPAASTIGDVLAEAGLVMKKGKHRSRHSPAPTKLGIAKAPNDIWCIDYKGQIRLGDRSYCYPLTVTDQMSRFLLGCEGMHRISDEEAREACEDLFRRFGLPKAIRSDNGVPFASRGLGGLTKLSAYWMLLGVRLERIRPAHPQDNGRHERMHRTLKFETAKPARANLLQQQETFDEFLTVYNNERPHEALSMKTPSKVYKNSTRAYPTTLPEPEYPGYDDVLRVSSKGFIHISGVGQAYVSQALSGMHVGVDEQADRRWLVSFMNLDLGYFDPGTRRIAPNT